MRKGLALVFALTSFLATGAAHAGLIGLGVTGNIGSDLYDAQSDSWGTSQETIGRGFEFRGVVDGNWQGANFQNNRLVISDIERPHQTSTGWQMTFQLLSPSEFKNVRLLSSNFAGGLTFSLVGNILTINWTGDQAYNDLTRKERRELGRERFRAVFGVTAEDDISAVPEPGALSLMAAGLVAAAAFGWRRKISASTL